LALLSSKYLTILWCPFRIATWRGEYPICRDLLTFALFCTKCFTIRVWPLWQAISNGVRIERMIHRTVPVSVNYILLFIITLCFYLALSLDMLILQFRMLYGGLKKVLKFIYRLLCICYNTLYVYAKHSTTSYG
jgi:hypothetical protein